VNRLAFTVLIGFLDNNLACPRAMILRCCFAGYDCVGY